MHQPTLELQSVDASTDSKTGVGWCINRLSIYSRLMHQPTLDLQSVDASTDPWKMAYHTDCPLTVIFLVRGEHIYVYILNLISPSKGNINSIYKCGKHGPNSKFYFGYFFKKNLSFFFNIFFNFSFKFHFKIFFRIVGEWVQTVMQSNLTSLNSRICTIYILIFF